MTLKKQELVSPPAIGEISHEIPGKVLLIDEKKHVIALCERKLGDFLRDFLSYRSSRMFGPRRSNVYFVGPILAVCSVLPPSSRP